MTSYSVALLQSSNLFSNRYRWHTPKRTTEYSAAPGSLRPHLGCQAAVQTIRRGKKPAHAELQELSTSLTAWAPDIVACNSTNVSQQVCKRVCLHKSQKRQQTWTWLDRAKQTSPRIPTDNQLSTENSTGKSVHTCGHQQTRYFP